MATKQTGSRPIQVTFVGLEAGESAPPAALYELDGRGRPAKKLERIVEGKLPLDAEKLKGRMIAIGPDVDDPASIDPRTLTRFRADEILPAWRDKGVLIPRDKWERLLLEIVCTSGRAWKCRPWWWSKLEALRLDDRVSVATLPRLQPAIDLPSLNLVWPVRCLPLCDGIVEVYERVCCCERIRIPDLLDRLRELLERIPIPIPDPIPDPWPPGPWPEIGPFPGPRPGPGPDPAPFARAVAPRLLKTSAIKLSAAQSPELAAVPSERMYDDYVALTRLAPAEAQQYVLEHPYLLGYICSCSMRKVGEVPLQPGGEFDFCYLRPRTPLAPHHRCYTTFAFRVRQLINGAWVTVYDGVAAHEYFSLGDEANLRSHDSRALVCGDGPGDGPPTDSGKPFVMLEHVGSAGTHHFNFPTQTAASRMGALAASSGLYTTAYAPDCPWGAGLGLRLWVSPELEGTAAYYRMSVVRVDNLGQPFGAPRLLDSPIAWSRFVFVGGNWVTTSEGLAANPASVGGQLGLFRIPYWSGGNYWLSGQYHQIWNTPQDADGKYLLVVELFDGAGNRIKPSGAPAAEPGAARNFEFRRWQNATDTANVPFADLAHVLWIDNTPVGADLVDLRRNGVPNTSECQFMSGPGATTLFSVGFRAYHVHGVSDADSFMYYYAIGWQRGLNGPTGSLTAGLTTTTDAGEGGPPAQSAQVSFASMLGSHTRCTFSVSLHVYAKHFTGSSRINGYDYHETASFALEAT